MTPNQPSPPEPLPAHVPTSITVGTFHGFQAAVESFKKFCLSGKGRRARPSYVGSRRIIVGSRSFLLEVGERKRPTGDYVMSSKISDNAGKRLTLPAIQRLIAADEPHQTDCQP